jgi:HAD superfamily hydrolase (TIGR01450 family)
VLDGVRGFVFDVDGTLVHRGADGRARPQPGALEVLDRVRASGRPLVLFTNGSHVSAATIARGLREDGVPIADEEMLTPVESAIRYLRRYHAGVPTMLFGSDAVAGRLREAGIALANGEEAGVVLVTHVDAVELVDVERAARAINAGAPLLTGSYARGYAGANGMIFSRGAMVTAAIAKVTGARPRVVGKPSHAAVREVSVRLGVPSRDVAVIGDDIGMDIALGKLGGALTVLVRTGISGDVDLERIPPPRRPDAVIDGVAELLPWI